MSSADVELLCTNCQLDDLTELTEALGGEASSKDAEALKVEGFPVVHAKLTRMKEISEQVSVLYWSFLCCFIFIMHSMLFHSFSSHYKVDYL